MAILNIVIGRAKTGKSTYLQKGFAAHIANLHDKPAYYIVPEQYTMVAERNILSMPEMKGNCLMNDEVLSFKRLAYRVLSRLGGMSQEHIDEHGKLMLVTQTAYENDDKLRYYVDVHNSPWQLMKLGQLFGEFDKYLLTPDDLRRISNETERDGSLSSKLADMAILYEAYKERLKPICMTEAEVYKECVAKARADGYFTNTRVWIDEFTGFTKVERDMIRLMLSDCDEVTVSICSDLNREPTFEGINATYDMLCSMADDMKVHRVVFDLNNDPLSIAARANSGRSKLISYAEKRYTELGSPNISYPAMDLSGAADDIEIHECATIFDEVSLACKRIQRLHSEKAISYGRIAVAVRNVDDYSPLLEAMMSREGIPYFVDTRRSVESDPVVLALLSLLSIVANGFRMQDAIAFLKTRVYITDIDTIDELENYIIARGLNGVRRWGAEQREECAKLYAEISSLKEAMSQADRLGDYVEAIVRFTSDSGIEANVRAECDTLIQNGNKEKAEERIRVWNIVAVMLRQLREFLGDIPATNVRKMCEQMRRLLSVGFSSYKAGFLPQSIDSVQIVGIDRSRVSEVSAMLLLGVNEGVLPASVSDSGLLNDAERDRMQAVGAELADDSRIKAYKEQYMIYATLFAPSQFLYVSYALQNAAGEAMMMSASVIRRLTQILPSVVIQQNEADDKAPSESIYSENTAANENAAVRPKRADISPQEARRLLLGGSNDLSLSEGDAQTVYPLSVSRIESYRQCPYKYFLTYGIGAKERETAEIDFIDIGNVMHLLIEKGTERLFEYDAQNAQDNDMRTYCDDVINELYDKALEKLGVGSYRELSGREQVVAERLNRFAVSALYAVYRQIDAGSFKPLGFELPFGTDNSVLPPVVIQADNGDSVKLIGRIDRCDVYVDAMSRMYLRVVDYKSSQQHMTREDIYSGLKLQLFTYLKALTGSESAKKAVVKLCEYKDGEISEVLPVGALYFSMSDDIESLRNRPTNIDEQEKSYKMSGFVLDEPEVTYAMVGDGSVPTIPLERGKKDKVSASAAYTMDEYSEISSVLENVIRETLTDISEGHYTPAPKAPNSGSGHSSQSSRSSLPCEYCPYAAVCGVKK